MAEFLRSLFASSEFMPHGHCFLWRPGLIWLHVSSDGLIGTAYLVIAGMLWRLVRKTRIPFSPMVLAFGLFIGLCGLTHYFEIFTLWVPDYWLSGTVKAATAAASVATGAFLFRANDAIAHVTQEARMAEGRREQLAATHRELEQSARRHQRAFRALSECSQALVKSASEKALLDAVCRIFVEVAGYRMCWVGLTSPEGRGGVHAVAHAGHEDGYLATTKAISVSMEDRGPGSTAVNARKTVIVADVRTDPEFAPWRDEAVKRGYGSLAALPLMAQGAALGVLQVYAPAADAFDGPESALLEELANDLAFGLTALRARAERDQATAQLMLADRMASVGRLAAGVAHEINNPLAYLLSALDFLNTELTALGGRQPDPRLAEMKEALAEAREGAQRVRHVVRDLKTFSRADEERRGVVDLRTVIQSAVKLASSEIKYRARLVLELGDAPLVHANEARMGQVFLNLLVNAAQAIPEGQVDKNEIRVVTRTDDRGRAVAEVRDTGAGIPADIIGQIFEPFFTTKPIGVGTGLGLSICRNIVSAAAGELSVESRPGEGAVFRVTLPPSPEIAGGGASAQVQAPAKAGRRGRVLVVDDEPALGDGIRRLLRSEHEVVVLTSAREARDLLARGERFDVILCDLMMPEITGMELHAQLLALAPDQAARMILLTGGAFTAAAQAFLETVPNPRIEKPFETETLRAMVRSRVR